MAEVITISYQDIIDNKNLSEDIEKAFGTQSLGLILIKDYPEFQAARKDILHAIRSFALLPDDVKEKYVRPECSYSYGWSHGKEKMKSGIPDYAKGSFYARPHHDVITDDQELKQKFPEIYADNIWPREDCPQLELSFKKMTKIQMEIGHVMCKLFDKYLHGLTKGDHKDGTFYNMIKDSMAYRSRMLHYFPVEKEVNKSIDGLCGWHLDHGCITCLLSPLYLNLNGEPISKPEECGLYVKSPRDGTVNKVDIPSDCLAIQLGETFQFLSGGHLRATPHCVRSCKDPSISREQLVCFMDCNATTKLNLPVYSQAFETVVNTPFLPEGVPALRKRIEGANTYQEFTSNTFKAYL